MFEKLGKFVRNGWGRYSQREDGSCHGLRGESLAEVIIAIFVVAMGSGVATSLIVNALQSNSFSRDNLIGLNLAVEGVEAIRTIRDTNWLRFSSDKNSCWNISPGKGTDIDACVIPANLIQPGNYTVDLVPKDDMWVMSDKYEPPLDQEKGLTDSVYRLGFIDIDPLKDSDGNNKLTDDKDLYLTYAYIQNNPGSVLDAGFSNFYRMITVSYKDNALPEDADSMNVTSTVQWKSQGSVHTVSLQSRLTNYQKAKK